MAKKILIIFYVVVAMIIAGIVLLCSANGAGLSDFSSGFKFSTKENGIIVERDVGKSLIVGGYSAGDAEGGNLELKSLLIPLHKMDFSKSKRQGAIDEIRRITEETEEIAMPAFRTSLPNKEIGFLLTTNRLIVVGKIGDREFSDELVELLKTADPGVRVKTYNDEEGGTIYKIVLSKKSAKNPFEVSSLITQKATEVESCWPVPILMDHTGQIVTHDGSSQ